MVIVAVMVLHSGPPFGPTLDGRAIKTVPARVPLLVAAFHFGNWFGTESFPGGEKASAGRLY